jgi:hypothetical protein
MRMIFLKTSIIILLILSFGLGCDKEKQEEVCDYVTIETDPAKLIIGKWELSKVWMGDRDGYKSVDELYPGESNYWQFEPDSLAKLQFFKDGVLHTSDLKYWVDSLLHFYHEDGFPLTPWIYEFQDNCTLDLGNAFPALSPVAHIYKRISQ